MKNNERGQAILIVLLLMAVILTIGLSVVSRSVTDIKISQQEEESARALSAAEAGIEDALKSGQAGQKTVGENEAEVTTFVTKTSVQTGNSFDFGGAKFSAGDGQTFWLANHDADGDMLDSGWSGASIDLYWGNNPVSGDVPAIEAILYYNDAGVVKTAKYCIDPLGSRRATNQCGDVDSPDPGYAYKKTLSTNFGDYAYFLRLKLIYNTEGQILKVQVPGVIPDQGNCYESTATIAQSGITRKIKQCEYYKAPPAIFDYTLFSEQNLETSP